MTATWAATGLRPGRYHERVSNASGGSGEGAAEGDQLRLFEALAQGESVASEALFPLVYDELRALALGMYRGGGETPTLQPTAVVNEAYLKLAGAAGAQWTGRDHFFALAARAMRQILIDHARRKDADKRGGAWDRVSLSGAADDITGGGADEAGLVDLELALAKLERESERQARVVELRYFGGLSVEEAARVLGVSERTVKADWRFARAWLRAELEGRG